MTDTLNHIDLAIGLIGGLALFLFGMDIMTRALKQVAGNSMKSLLARVTNNRITGLVAGAGVTAVIQSSSITTVLLVGFISAGLMSTLQAVPVILGANIGTTITAQILAFRVETMALPLLSLGFFTSLLASQKATREYARIVLGLGMVFFGMSIMSDAMNPLRSFQPFITFMLSLDHVLLAVLVGAGFTALVQSSSATTGILIVMAGQGLIGLETAVALALGANIGTCITALLSAIGHPRDALRAALVHTLFNVAGVVIWIGFVDQLADLARMITNAGDVPRQLANVHSFFNVFNAMLFLPFTKQLAGLVTRLVPDKAVALDTASLPKHLKPEFLDVPALANDAIRRETLRLGNKLQAMLVAAIPALTTGSPMDVDNVRLMDRPIDLLHREIVSYIRQLSLRSLSDVQSSALLGLMRIANDIEHAADLIATGLVTSANKRLNENVLISDTTAAAIASLHRDVVKALEGVLAALGEESAAIATEMRTGKEAFQKKIAALVHHEMARLRSDDAQRLQTYAREMELIQTLDDIYKILRRIARTEMMLFRVPDNETRQ